jgi:hypothetical protein
VQSRTKISSAGETRDAVPEHTGDKRRGKAKKKRSVHAST